MISDMSDEDLKDLRDYPRGFYDNLTHGFAAELLQRREEERKTCPWRLNIDGVWETGCGHEFITVIEDEEPMRFCPWCGHRIEEAKPWPSQRKPQP